MNTRIILAACAALLLDTATIDAQSIPGGLPPAKLPEIGAPTSIPPLTAPPTGLPGTGAPAPTLGGALPLTTPPAGFSGATAAPPTPAAPLPLTAPPAGLPGTGALAPTPGAAPAQTAPPTVNGAGISGVQPPPTGYPPTGPSTVVGTITRGPDTLLKLTSGNAEIRVGGESGDPNQPGSLATAEGSVAVLHAPRTGQDIIREAKLKVLQKHYAETLDETIQLEKAAISATPDERAKLEATAQAMRDFLTKLETDLQSLAPRPGPATAESADSNPTIQEYRGAFLPSADRQPAAGADSNRASTGARVPKLDLDTAPVPTGISGEPPTPSTSNDSSNGGPPRLPLNPVSPATRP